MPTPLASQTDPPPSTRVTPPAPHPTTAPVTPHQRSHPGARAGAVPAPSPDPGPAGPQVLIAGVGPVHGHGLCSVLATDGVRGRFVPDLDGLRAAAGAAGECVVVVPQTRVAEVLRVLDRRAGSRVRLVLLLADHEPASYLAGLRAGALSLVPAGADLSDVVAVVGAAARGFTVLPTDVARDLCRPLTAASALDVPARERQWLRQIAEGATVAELAQRSAYSEREMYRQLGALYRRLGATSRTGALIAAQRAGLLAA